VLIFIFLMVQLIICVITIFVSTTVIAKKLTRRAARITEQFSQSLEPFPAEMAKLLTVGCLDRFIQPSE
jgi:hypothetical protein